MSYFPDSLQGPYNTAAKVIVAVSAGCGGVAFGQLISTLLTRPATKTAGGNLAWYWLVPTTLLLVGTHAFNMYAGIKDVRADRIMSYDRGYPRSHTGWHEAAIILPELFMVFQILALRIVWYVIVSPLVAAKSRTKSLWAFRILDILCVLGGLGSSIAATAEADYFGVCWENDCGNAVQFAIMGHYNGLGLSFFFIIFPCMHFVIAAAAIWLAARWLPRSPLAAAMLRLVSPFVVLELVLYIVAIAVACSFDPDHSNGMYKAYYASIPFFISQVVLLSVLQHVLRAAPAHSENDAVDAKRPFARASGKQEVCEV